MADEFRAVDKLSNRDYKIKTYSTSSNLLFQAKLIMGHDYWKTVELSQNPDQVQQQKTGLTKRGVS